MRPPLLGIVVTHPIQYQAPLYRYLAQHSSVEPVVFFLTEHGLDESFDPGFGLQLKYDVSLLGGYRHRFARNWSPFPGVGTPWGVINPGLPMLIKRTHVDALLLHGYSNASLWLGYLTATALGIPYLLRGESRPDREGAPRARLLAKQALLRPLVQRAGACLAIGSENRAFYLSYGASEEHVFSSPYSVDTDRFAKDGALGRASRAARLSALDLDPGLPTVLFAAKLQPWKRPTDLVMAMDRSRGLANLVLIGDGPLRADLEFMAETRPWMRVLGFVNQTQIAQWYGAADMYVLPSDREPWGLAVNEAMAAGAVPIVSDAVGCGFDLVTPETGWVYPTGDIARLADAIAQGCRPGALFERRSAAKHRSENNGIKATARGIETALAAVLTH